MKFPTFIIILLLLGFLLDYNPGNSIEEYSGKQNYTNTHELEQPLPLILVKDSSFILQPIVENIDSKNYSFIMSLKLYYKDKMAKPLEFKKGPPLDTYCSDSTFIVFYLQHGNVVEISSVKRMSCRILAIFNINKSQNILLKTYPMDSIRVTNGVTNNNYIIVVSDKQYLNRLITKYNNWH
jgi:hypothetical protein